uniref:RING-type E3 ubiquitin transferase n=1 Tax=Nothoprocta perdicaria TaxID=30464 RepID=A0A8C6ZJ21_NOTPE
GASGSPPAMAESFRAEASCPLCRGLFQDPVSVPCGHSFCRGCIRSPPCARFLLFPGCPARYIPLFLAFSFKLCREVFLRPNRALANVADIVRQLAPRRGDGDEEEEGGGLCAKHREALKLYCQDDGRCICVVCDRSREHRAHAVVPVDEAAEEYQVARGGAGASRIEAERQRLLGEFEGLRQFLREQETLLLGQLEKLEKGIAKRQDDNITDLSKEITLLNKLITELEEKAQQPTLEFLKVSALEPQHLQDLSRSEQVKCPPPAPVCADMKMPVCNFALKTVVLEKILKKFRGGRQWGGKGGNSGGRGGGTRGGVLGEKTRV